MRVLGIVPARGGSKRVPRKNVRLLGGKPLVRWAIDAALGARSIARVVVSSDDDEILGIARAIDPRLPLRRPDALSGDRALAVDYVRHALEALEGGGEPRFEAVAIVQPSSPLTTSADVDATIALLARGEAPSAVSVVKLDHALHPWKLKRLVGERLVAFFEEERGRTASHEVPELYVRNGSVYTATRALVDEGKVIADDALAYVMPRERSIDVNDEVDLALAELLLARAKARPGAAES